MTYEHVLHGCAPVPLGSYLKALGVFRLVAEQADADARAFWRDERFVLKTRLSEDELIRFFVEDYEPTPIISPWNGRAGFLEGEDEGSNQQSSRQGAELIRRYEAAGPRFEKIRSSVESYRSMKLIKELDRSRAEVKILDKKKKAQGNKLSAIEEMRLKELAILTKSLKGTAIQTLRSEAPDTAVNWFDACQRITIEDAKMPLLGSGGNDGSRDFGMNFGSALIELFDLDSGAPLTKTASFFRNSLGFDIVHGLKSDNLGQFEPGGSGENTTSGFQGEQSFNPVDLVLLLEGSVLFLGAATRRLESDENRLSFPFTVSALTAGSGAVAEADDQGFAEFWAPLWMQPVRLPELKAFLSEGRTTVNGKTARDGLEFAVAISALGSQRGVSEYQRFALLQREPRSPKKATPLGRVRVRENPRASLISELDANGWLSRARRIARTTPTLAASGRSLDDTLFRLAGDGSPEAVQEALIAFGSVVREIGRRPKLREKKEGVGPPPRLSVGWAEAADDGSPEFALAAALASLDAAADGAEENGLRLPFRTHLVPLAARRWNDDWDDTTESQALVVWTGRNLVRDMADVLERRLLEAHRHRFMGDQKQDELPLRGWRPAPLAAVAAFLAGRTDEDRIAALAEALAWARSPTKLQYLAPREDQLPFAYAALKPVLAPDGVGPEKGEKRLLDPLPLVQLIRAGRVENAVVLAQRMARAAGLPAPYSLLPASPAADPLRLAAALLFPIVGKANDRLIARAYPDSTQDEQDSDAA